MTKKGRSNTFHILELTVKSLISVSEKEDEKVNRESERTKKMNRTLCAQLLLIGDSSQVLLCCRLYARLLQSLHFFRHLRVSPQGFL